MCVYAYVCACVWTWLCVCKRVHFVSVRVSASALFEFCAVCARLVCVCMRGI